MTTALVQVGRQFWRARVAALTAAGAAAATLAVISAMMACSPRVVVVPTGRPAPATVAAAPADGLHPELTLVDVATQGDGDWLRYRIPALTVAPNGNLLAFYDGRPSMQDLPSPISLLMRRSTDGGRTWQAPRIIRSAPAPAGFGDPSALVDRMTGQVFVFHAASIDAGFGSSTTGSDDADPRVLHADYGVSSDNGATWTYRRITAELKAGHADWAGLFAASGEAIQIRRGRYAGRLIQQYTVRIKNSNYAFSAYSDDHGATWHTSEPVGPGADENKTVELSDGRILLNARAAPFRLIAFSSDGGATYTTLAADTALPDPGNNGSIIRAFPDADPADPRARMLLFSNAANRQVRRDLTVRLSCDNGATWPVSRMVQTGAAAYSTLTPLRGPDGRLGGRYGLLYERDGYRYISFTSFTLEWLGGGCGATATGAREAAATASTSTQSTASLALRPVIDAIYPNDPPGFLGDRIQPWVEVINTGTASLTDIAITATKASGTCRFQSLVPGATTVCRNNAPYRIVTAADLAAGSWAPVFRATARAGAAIIEGSAALFPVELIERRTATPRHATTWVPTGVFESSSFVRVPRVGAPGEALADGARLDLLVPRNSRTSAQLVVTAPAELNQLRVDIGPLVSRSGTKLPATTVEVRYPDYVVDLEAGGLVEDPLRAMASVDVEAGRNQPVWITARVPAAARPGIYGADVVVKSAAGVIGRYRLQLAVPEATMRRVADRPFVLDLWAHPDAVADYLRLKPWSDAHFAALAPYWADLAATGQRVINVAITEDPWLVDHQGTIRAQTWSPYRSTVDWHWDGARFAFNFDVFDRLVSDALRAGIGPDIHAFGLLQFQGRDRIAYTDTRTGERRSETVALESPRYREAWTSFLAAFEQHLQEKGWLERTRLAFDEQPLARMTAVFDLLRAAGPAWPNRVALAANSLAEGDIAQVIAFNFAFLDRVPQALIDRRRAAGRRTLFYTWAEPVAPNTITGTPPYNLRTLPWVAAARHLDGYLRWSYNSWPRDVYEQPKFRYAQGDEYLVYPGADGPVSSIRWELFRDGLEDVELLDLAGKQTGGSARAAEALAAVNAVGSSASASWASLVAHRARLIAALARP
ncbi:MAG TPA: glycoside hydrolase domain-containing protein [Gemmatimonadaceae bacterium]